MVEKSGRARLAYFLDLYPTTASPVLRGGPAARTERKLPALRQNLGSRKEGRGDANTQWACATPGE